MIRLEVKERITKEGIKRVLQNEDLSKSKKMIELFKGGLDVKEISKLLEVRYNFVYNVVKNFLIKEGLLDDIVKEKKHSKRSDIIKYWLDGYSVIDIAKELRTNYNYVWKVCRECLDNPELMKEYEERRKSEKNK